MALADDEGLLDQSEIEALLNSMGGDAQAAIQAPVAPRSPAAPAPSTKSASATLAPPPIASGLGSSGASAAPKATSAEPGVDAGTNEFKVKPFSLPELNSRTVIAGDDNLSLILDVDLDVRIELGRARMYIEDVLKLREGSIVTLNKLAGDPVDVFVNGRLLARGEVLVLNDNFCIRVSEVIGESAGKEK